MWLRSVAVLIIHRVPACLSTWCPGQLHAANHSFAATSLRSFRSTQLRRGFACFARGKKKLLSRCCVRPHGRSSVQYPSRPHQRTLRCLCKCWAWYHFFEIMLQSHSEVTLTKVASGLWCKGSEGSTLSYRKTMRCGSRSQHCSSVAIASLDHLKRAYRESDKQKNLQSAFLDLSGRSDYCTHTSLSRLSWL